MINLSAPSSIPVTGCAQDPSRQWSRNQALDVLRCLAILLVLGFHLPYYRVWGRVGWIGVDLFFVLSGFLISSLLFSEFQASGKIAFHRFVLRRGFKIWPPFYVLLAITTLLLSNRRPFPLGGILANAFFVQNYFFQHSPWHLALMGHAWSLAVEEHFYLFLPLLLMVLARFKRNSSNPFSAIPYIFAAIALSCLGFRLFALPAGTFRIVAPTHMRIDSLFAGVVIGYFYGFRPDLLRKFATPLAPAMAGLFCLPSFFTTSESRWMQTFGLTGLYVGFSFLVAWAVQRKPLEGTAGAFARAAAAVGRYSYSIYLWHWILSLLFWTVRTSLLAFWCYMALSIALGIVMATLIELPSLALRERVVPSPRSTLGPRICTR
jgi:peptidoglycan/LPS O-acetylase OafA/YrhL